MAKRDTQASENPVDKKRVKKSKDQERTEKTRVIPHEQHKIIDQEDQEQQSQKKGSQQSNDSKNARLLTLESLFPLTLSPSDIELDPTMVASDDSAYVYKGKYRQLGILCTCIKPQEETRAQYEWAMSQMLSACRNMETYIGRFKSTAEHMRIKLPEGSKKATCWFFVKRSYQTLEEYMALQKSKKIVLEPLYFIQMAITLFSILVDAHALNIGLVNISPKSICVGTDGGLYFGEFKSCVLLDEPKPLRDKGWIRISAQHTPDVKIIKRGDYKKESDMIYTVQLLKYIINENTCNDQNLKNFYKKLGSVLSLGLRKSTHSRTKAESMLKYFENLRHDALNVNDDKDD
ncbi:hypothetical protein CU098_013233 [Rhizopus stolonifer]|uniref:Protein kinase domain-containing protein n=1 Tax=Rhizopus stolonifer TaxID=4846 RepID=A0A367KTB8_RHIST|nr:hypothetical protein CU098_013233 [Rhizopus stolonifer]